MIPALIAALSVPGLWTAWRLLKPVPLTARFLPPEPDDTDIVSFGFDARGLVD